ncbi:CpsD/CapB family tyrosine-protein kinase [Planococcus beigongshangi]|uniref:CpsD/CapB family tyrosine-protein kinase n=1 Tax=Planococcus beigongshangi TaxID=2782536 RepID=UPI00193B0B9E|nr:CpsD/CapB family tyrosine-protein kinase [Planococcus beigongshangi]
MVKKLKGNRAANKLVAYTSPRSMAAEQFRTLRTNINFSSPDDVIKTIVVTSASAAEGKSTTAANLAVVYAQDGRKVLLVDGDMRRPTVHLTFNIQNVIGLSNLLTRQNSSENAIRYSGIIGLDLLPCGPLPPNQAELLSSKSMDKLIQKLKGIYDIIIFDVPPILLVTDGQLLANKCDGCILVVNSGTTDKRKALKAKDAITMSKSKLIGVVLNNFTVSKEHIYYAN